VRCGSSCGLRPAAAASARRDETLSRIGRSLFARPCQQRPPSDDHLLSSFLPACFLPLLSLRPPLMTSRININRPAQSAPQPSYQPSVPMSGGGGHRRQQSTMQGLATTLGMDESQLEGVKKVTSKVEDAIENLTHPIKPYLPALSRSVCRLPLLGPTLLFGLPVSRGEMAARDVARWPGRETPPSRTEYGSGYFARREGSSAGLGCSWSRRRPCLLCRAPVELWTGGLTVSTSFPSPRARALSRLRPPTRTTSSYHLLGSASPDSSSSPPSSRMRSASSLSSATSSGTCRRASSRACSPVPAPAG